MTAHVQQVDDFGTCPDNVRPNLVLLGSMGKLCHVLVTVSIETYDFVSDRRCTAIGLLVLKVEHFGSQKTITIVQGTGRRGQKSRKGGLSSVDITKHSNSQVIS